MLFNSYIFVLLFLPLSLLGYFLLNRIKKYSLSKAWLLCMSLWFYAYFNVIYLPIIVGSIFINFSINYLFFKIEKQTLRKLLLALAVLINIGVLFYFKYYGFFIENINTAFSMSVHFEKLILPLGISFFTFQQLSYIIDSYSKKVPNYNLLDYALFVTFFPQLIAGPIVTHDEIVPQFEDESKKKLNFDNLAKGIMAFSFGLAKKVIIADTFGNAANWGFSNISALDSTNAIITMLAYTIQIYFDFSGYCDMATGIGLMFNIDIPINFNSPYKALTITDFWSRWHITLTRFFTAYIYIPLGGNRKGALRTYCNIFIVFLVSGLWHGANWTFVFWGVLHGVASVITRIFDKKIDKLHPAFNWLVTFGFINLSWIYFRADTIALGSQMIKSISKMNFGPINFNLVAPFNLTELIFFMDIVFSKLTGVNLFSFYPYLFFACFFFFAIIAILVMKNTNERVNNFRPTLIYSVTSVIFLVWSILSFSGVSTFLYFNF